MRSFVRKDVLKPNKQTPLLAVAHLSRFSILLLFLNTSGVCFHAFSSYSYPPGLIPLQNISFFHINSEYHTMFFQKLTSGFSLTTIHTQCTIPNLQPLSFSLFFPLLSLCMQNRLYRESTKSRLRALLRASSSFEFHVCKNNTPTIQRSEEHQRSVLSSPVFISIQGLCLCNPSSPTMLIHRESGGWWCPWEE